jgi:hypothetical protein
MQYLKALVESRPYLMRVPDQALLKSPAGKDGDHCQATRDSDASYAFIYVPYGGTIQVDLRRLSGRKLRAWWFNPREGGANPAGEREAGAIQEFTPPAPAKSGVANDWVLVLDDASKGYAMPGR